jgi:H+/Cl- antiporter ClcA
MSDQTAPAAPPTAPQLGGPAYLRLIGIGAALGIPAALVAVAFLAAVHWLEHELWTSLPTALGLDAPPWWLILGIPVVGALLVWFARAALPGDGGHEPLGGISLAPTPISYAPGVALAALGSLAFGMVLGPEAPLIALGSVVGMVAARIWKVSGPASQVVSTAGAFSAVSALFGGPVVAGALLLEAGVGLGSALIPVLLPGAVAAAVGYVIIVGVGGWTGVPTSGMTVPDLPAYPTTRIIDLLLAIVIGLVVGLLVFVVKHVAAGVSAARPRVGMGPMLVLGALAVGGLTLLVQAAGGTYEDVLFSGQTTLPNLLAITDEKLILLILLAKALGYAICLGAGFRGGPVFPAMFVGTAAALLIGLPFGMSTTAVLAIGAACGMAAFTRLIFSSLVFVILLEGPVGLGAIPAAVLGAVTAWVVGKFLDQRQADAAGDTAVAAGPTADPGHATA